MLHWCISGSRLSTPTPALELANLRCRHAGGDGIKKLGLAKLPLMRGSWEVPSKIRIEVANFTR
jgi:hypothetical protein